MPDNDRLFSILESFSACTGVPVTLYGAEGEILREYAPELKFCKYFPQYTNPESVCRDSLGFSARISYDIGQPYIFYCPVGLVHVAVPVIDGEGHYNGCAMAGPLIMGELDDRLLDQVISLNDTPPSELASIAMFTSRIERHSPVWVQRLSELMYAAVASDRANEQDAYRAAAARHKIQLAMGEQIRQRKHAVLNTPSNRTCAELEETFEDLLQGQDLNAALDCMNQLINELVLVEGGNFDSIKVRLLGIFLNLVQVAMENGIPLRKIFGSDLRMFATLSRVDNIKDLSVWAEDTARFFFSEVFSGFSYLSATAAQAVAYLSDHYMDKITLHELASTLFVSDSYLSKLFRQELGISFTEYLNKIRVDRSIDLIREGKHSLLEIAGMVGFDDQSYFTKVFKRYTGVTPRVYKAGAAAPEDRP